MWHQADVGRCPSLMQHWSNEIEFDYAFALLLLLRA
jgi:hypothetical protein